MKNSILLILFVCGLAFFCSIFIVKKVFSGSDIEVLENEPLNYIQISSPTQNNTNYENFKSIINDSTLLLMGSSELSNVSEMMPNIFFSKNLHKQVLAIGHAGAQSFAELSFLASHQKILKNKNIVILVSPNWFCGKSAKGTHPELFLEYFDYENYDYQSTNTSARKLISDYYISNQHDLENSFASTGKFLNAENSTYSKLILTNTSALGKVLKREILSTTNKRNVDNSDSKRTIINMIEKGKPECTYTINWDSIINVESTTFLKSCNNNLLGIDSAYYVDYCIGKLPYELKPFGASTNKELQDFKFLLKYLKEEKFNPLIVILPVNNYAYKVSDFIPLHQDICNEIKSYRFNYLNLFTSDTMHYKKGMCKDIMHTGPLGWIEINKKIMETFYGKN